MLKISNNSQALQLPCHFLNILLQVDSYIRSKFKYTKTFQPYHCHVIELTFHMTAADTGMELIRVA